MNENLQSKYQFIDGPLQQLPHKCAGCGTYGTESNNKFLDFNLEVEFFGKIFFCVSCLTEVANQMDYHSPTQWKAKCRRVEEVEDLAWRLERENTELKNAVASLSDTLGIDSGALVSDSLASIEARETAALITKDESGLTEQTTEQGFTDLSDNDSVDAIISNLDI